MPRFIEPLWLLLATVTDPQLRRMVEYLKAENRILRDKLPDCMTVTPGERHRLVQLGAKLGPAIRDLITVVTPRTFVRWLAGAKSQKAAPTPTCKPGRPRTAEDLRELVLRIARETGWGYARILGELRSLASARSAAVPG